MAAARILVVDVGGNNAKLRLGAAGEKRKVPTGPAMTPERMLEGIREITRDWRWDRVAVGVPGPVIDNRIVKEPVNLGPGWLGFDFAKAFGVPTRVVNDAAMQALGSYQGGTMLFMGFGTGLGMTLIVDGTIVPLELMHLPWKKGLTYEDFVGLRGLERLGEKKWHRTVLEVIGLFKDALVAEDVVIGGGNAKRLKELPPGVRLGHNDNAFIGGVRIWQGAGFQPGEPDPPSKPATPPAGPVATRRPRRPSGRPAPATPR
jgi:hypothetical protein